MYDYAFNFAAPEVLATLQKINNSGTLFMGTATSDFQSHPLLANKSGKKKFTTDWELEAWKSVRGKNSEIIGEQSVAEFPKFFEKKDLYIQKSAEMGENMFRLSFDFGRLCPKPGVFNTELMEEYIQILGLIRQRGMEPMITLYHWPIPVHLLELDKDKKILAGAWENSQLLHHFRFYVENVIRYLSDADKIRQALLNGGCKPQAADKLISEGLVRYFVSINEPINLLLPTYILGIFPPYKKGRLDLIGKVLEKVLDAHDIAITEIKNSKLITSRGAPKIGAAHNWNYFEGMFGRLAHHLINGRLARKFELERKETDFIGLHYYFRMSLTGKKHKVYGDNPYFGDIHPPGIYHVLKEMNKEYPHKEIYITEFGFSDRQDERRPYWILETLRYIIQALEHGIPVRGMLLWTLVNNFEWNLGTYQKFGLFDEKELGAPLVPSNGSHIRGWEAWQAAVQAMTQPTPEHLKSLQTCYVKSHLQFQDHRPVLER